MGDYYSGTDDYLRSHGRGPTCPRCGGEMFPSDDHGRFTCLCNLASALDVVTGDTLDVPAIPQVDTSNMLDTDQGQD